MRRLEGKVDRGQERGKRGFQRVPDALRLDQPRRMHKIYMRIWMDWLNVKIYPLVLVKGPAPC